MHCCFFFFFCILHSPSGFFPFFLCGSMSSSCVHSYSPSSNVKSCLDEVWWFAPGVVVPLLLLQKVCGSSLAVPIRAAQLLVPLPLALLVMFATSVELVVLEATGHPFWPSMSFKSRKTERKTERKKERKNCNDHAFMHNPLM